MLFVPARHLRAHIPRLPEPLNSQGLSSGLESWRSSGVQGIDKSSFKGIYKGSCLGFRVPLKGIYNGSFKGSITGLRGFGLSGFREFRGFRDV